jgi:hypothetical protein
MTHEKYNTIIDDALQYAGPGPEWNAMFELHLIKNGLKIVDKKPVRHPDGNDLMTPVPVIGERHQYPYPSWIVEL